METRKSVRVTVELPNSFVGLLNAKAQLSHWRDKALGDYGQGIDAGDILGLLILMEARGALEDEIEAVIPEMWRVDGPKIIYSERKVLEQKVNLTVPTKKARAKRCMICEDCGVKNDQVEKTVCPYDSDVNNKTTPVKLCPNCLRDRAQNI